MVVYYPYPNKVIRVFIIMLFLFGFHLDVGNTTLAMIITLAGGVTLLSCVYKRHSSTVNTQQCIAD